MIVKLTEVNHVTGEIKHFSEIPKTPMSAHKLLSFIKSGIRIVACIIGVCGGLYMDFDTILVAFALLGIAEFLGIVEEREEK
jgi:hypothetical protein